ncbi:hypothetical protein M2275_006619 [Rhodococcus opacus]|nr:hypothetical protein [Rhodococcus opacus]
MPPPPAGFLKSGGAVAKAGLTWVRRRSLSGSRCIVATQVRRTRVVER